jgi:diaminohydroxyphosphoribosylaminopyrimidine deaminase/5-amino-6-(5-phosphoribosylamino)uracil reductase
MTARQDIVHMRHALRLAARGLGRVAPNPAVGCVIVAPDGRIVGRGWTQKGGRPHAEAVALGEAGAAARGATAYVSLEPCAHHGQTPPCTDALIAAGVARVAGAVLDPDSRVSGQGFAKLAAAGIAVTQDVCAEEARALNAGFLMRVTANRPLVALKIAQSADGYVADAQGKSKWITGARARAHGHLLRAKHDAIMVGVGTALADDPALTCRLPGLEDRSPLRLVLDSRLRLPAASQLASTAREVPTIVFTAEQSGGEQLAALGVVIERVAAQHGRVALPEVLRRLAARGVTRLLVEGGPTVHAALLAERLADRLYLYRAPLLLGEGGKPGLASLGPAALSTAPHLKQIECLELAPDVLESFEVTG